MLTHHNDQFSCQNAVIKGSYEHLKSVHILGGISLTPPHCVQSMASLTNIVRYSSEVSIEYIGWLSYRFFKNKPDNAN